MIRSPLRARYALVTRSLRARCTAATRPLHCRYYSRYCIAVTAAVTAPQVELDLNRTFPEHDAFKAEEGRASLRRLLLAQATRNPKVRSLT